METKESLGSLKVGSRVVVVYRHTRELAKIERETKTQWIVGSNRYRKTDGEQIGGGNSWSNPYIKPATTEDVEWCIRRRLISKLNHVTAEGLAERDTASLEEACRLLGLAT